MGCPLVGGYITPPQEGWWGIAQGVKGYAERITS